MGVLNLFFSDIPTPDSDETLSSWIFRCSVYRRAKVCCLLRLEDRPSSWWDNLDLKYEDPDIDFATSVTRLGDAGIETNARLLEAHFAMRTGKLVEWKYRRFYCPQCLIDDVAGGHLPRWRKSWCYEGASACILHGRHLDTLVDASRYSKAWDAFVQHCNSNVCRSVADAENGMKFSRLRSTTISLVSKRIFYGRDPRQDGIACLFSKLYQIFLQAPFKGSHGGAARIHFHTQRRDRFAESQTLEHSFMIGPSTADSSSRFGSMILAAALLGVITETRYLVLSRAHETTVFHSLLPADLHQAAAFPYLDRRGYGVLYEFLGIVPRASYPILDRHLQLQDQRYKSDGTSDGRLLGVHHAA